MKNWDSEIDEVARAMTEGEPHGSLKARVLAGIDGPARPAWRSPWILAPIATVAIAVVALFVMRGPGEVGVKPGLSARPSTGSGRAVEGPNSTTAKPDPTPEPVGAAPEATRRLADQPPPRLRRSAVASAKAEARTAREGGTGVRTTRVAAEDQAASIDSLAPPPLVIDPLDVDEMENMESLQVPALSVALLEVPAIGEQ